MDFSSLALVVLDFEVAARSTAFLHAFSGSLKREIGLRDCNFALFTLIWCWGGGIFNMVRL